MDKTLLKIIKIIGIIFIFYLLYLLYPGIKHIFYWLIKILIPFLIGFVGAYLLLPLANKLTKYKISYKASALIVVSVFVVILVFILGVFLPKTLDQTIIFVENLPHYLNSLSSKLDSICEKLDFLPKQFLPSDENIIGFFETIVRRINDNIDNIISNASYYLLTLLISPILMVYFLLDFKKITKFIKNKLLKNDKLHLYETLIEIDKAMRSYFNGVIIVMILLSIIATILFRIVGIELPLLWGVIIGITNIIPYIGPYIGGAIVVLFTLATSVKKTISVLIIIVVLQLVESNLITPNIHSKTTKTSPILVLLAVSVFGDLMGIFGMIIAIPILSIIQILLSKIETVKN